jgi:hypothetical protein
MDKQEAYKIVLDDLKQVNLFCGIYDARQNDNGVKDKYMHGIESVMETIAHNAGEPEFDDMFLDNLIASKKRAECVIYED